VGLVRLRVSVEWFVIIGLFIHTLGHDPFTITLLLLHADHGEVRGIVCCAPGLLGCAESSSLAFAEATFSLVGEAFLRQGELTLEPGNGTLVRTSFTAGVTAPGFALLVVAVAVADSLVTALAAWLCTT
jgi:hypothetical protein